MSFIKKHKIALSVTAGIILIIAIVLGSIAIAESTYIDVETNNALPSSEEQYNWSANDKFDINDLHHLTIKPKSGDGNIKIMNFTDIHTMNEGTFGSMIGMNYLLDGLLFYQMDRLVGKTNPDLIVISGDLTTYKGEAHAYDVIIDRMDSICKKYDCYWTMAFGNHDAEYTMNKWELSKKLMTKSDRCLFNAGPTNFTFDSSKLADPKTFYDGKAYNGYVGMGNFIIKVVDNNNNVKQAIIMMDTNDYNSKDPSSPKHYSSPVYGIYPMQIEWYNWVMEGLTAYNGGKPIPTTMYSHISTYPYTDSTDPGLAALAGGAITSWDYDGKKLDFNESVLKYNSTKQFLFGHNHAQGGTYSFEDTGITYINVNKSGFNYNDDTQKTGGTYLEVKSDGTIKVTHYYDSLFSIKELA